MTATPPAHPQPAVAAVSALRPLLLAAILASLLSGCADPTPPSVDCGPQAQWRAGLARYPAPPTCTDPAGLEAHLLGTELAGLRDEFAQLEQRLGEASPESAGALRRRQRQLQIDIEAIEAEARVRGW